MIKNSRREDIKVEFEGKEYHGYRIIKGSNKIFQTIFYKHYNEFDGHPYKPSEGVYMETHAKIILIDLMRHDK
ncbi:MAG: hypothetical protein WC602_06215 [archaeon]